MELRQLRAFAAVARLGTFRAAAADLHLTQPALWQQVRALQDGLGVALFERVGRRVRVTRAGTQLLERAEAVLGASDRLRELATAMRAGREGIVSIATSAPPVQLVLAEEIGAHARAHPDVRVEIHDAMSPIDALAGGEVDLAVAPRHDGFDGFRLFEARVVLVVPDGHRWAGADRVHVRKLRGEPLLTAPVGSLSRTLLDRACDGAGFAPAVRLAASSPGMLVALARHGYGIGVLATDAIAGTGARATPRLAHDGGVLATEVWLHWRRHADLEPVVAQLVDRLRRRARRRA